MTGNVEGGLPGRRHDSHLLGEPVEGLAVLIGETLGQLEILCAAGARGLGEA
jgi:hypothetical protein